MTGEKSELNGVTIEGDDKPAEEEIGGSLVGVTGEVTGTASGTQ